MPAEPHRRHARNPADAGGRPCHRRHGLGDAGLADRVPGGRRLRHRQLPVRLVVSEIAGQGRTPAHSPTSQTRIVSSPPAAAVNPSGANATAPMSPTLPVEGVPQPADRVPEFDQPVGTAGEERLPVRRERDAEDRPGVGGPDRAAGGNRPGPRAATVSQGRRRGGRPTGERQWSSPNPTDLPSERYTSPVRAGPHADHPRPRHVTAATTYRRR